MNFLFKYGFLLTVTILLSACGTAKLEKREQTINRQFGGFERSGYLARARTWLPIIQDNMVYALGKARNLKYEFPLISRYAQKVTASDRRLRIFSWDNRAGNQGHFWSVIAQYRTEKNKTKGTMLTDGYYNGPDAFLGAQVTEIFVLEDCERTFYLTLGMDLNQDETERWIFQILEVQEEDLIVCQNCLNDKKELIANLTEGEEFDYTFDPQKKTLEYLEFVIEPDGGDMSRRVAYEWKDCKFVLKK